jgi:hypothetical protein
MRRTDVANNMTLWDRVSMSPDELLLAVAQGDQRLATALRAAFEHVRDHGENAELREMAQSFLADNVDLDLDDELAGAYERALAIVSAGGFAEFVSGRDPDQMRDLTEAVLRVRHLIPDDLPGLKPRRKPVSAAGQWLHALTVRDIARRNTIGADALPNGITRGDAMMLQAAFELAVNGLYISYPGPPDEATLARQIVEIDRPSVSLTLANTEAMIRAALGQDVPVDGISEGERILTSIRVFVRINEYRGSTWSDVAEVIADAEKAVMAKGWKPKPYTYLPAD